MQELDNKALKIVNIVFVVVSIIFVIYATITMRGLYLDGSFYMFSILNNFDNNNYWVVADFCRTRFFINFLQELPISFANLVLRIDDKNTLMMVYSCTQFLLPLLALWWNYNLTKRTKRIDLLFWSLFNYCVVLITYSIFSVSEALLGSTLHFILWNYMAGKIDYNKKDIILIVLLSIIMFATWEYVIFLGPIFYIASFIYAKREENKKNRLIKNLIGNFALFAGIFNLIYMIRIAIIMPGEGLYFLKELHDYIPFLLNLCSIISIFTIIFLIIAFFKRNSITKTFIITIIIIYICLLIRLLNTLNLSLNPMWESHLRSITFWMIPCLFFGIFIFDMLKKEYSNIKMQNYITIVLLCGIFQTIWQCVHTYYWDINVKYMKNEINNANSLLYIPSEHDEISSFLEPNLRRYIWWGNYAVMSILLSDTYKIKTLVVNYDDRDYEVGNKTFRNRLYVMPRENLISIPYGVSVPIVNKYWDLTEVADALHKHNIEHNIKTDK